MDVSFALNLYDSDGEMYEQCVLLFLGHAEENNDTTILKFKSLLELKLFCDNIQYTIIPEICSDNFDELSEEDQADFGD